MPKVTSSRRNTISARNEATGLLERISISRETIDKFANVGKPRRVYKPVVKPLIKRFDPDFQAEINAQFEQHIDHLKESAQAVADKQREERYLSFLNNMQLQYPLDPYVPPEPLPKELFFRRTKILNRCTEYTNMLEATKKRLKPVKAKLLREEALFKRFNSWDKEKREVSDKIHSLLDCLDQIEGWLKDEDQITNATWRRMRTDFHTIGRISLKNLNKNWLYIKMSLCNAFDNGFHY